MGMGNQIATSGTGAPAGKGGTSGVGGVMPGGMTGPDPFKGYVADSFSGGDRPSLGMPKESSIGMGGMMAGLPTAGSVPTTSSGENYFSQNPDVAKAFGENTYGMNQEDFARTHFQKFGQSEGRTFGSPQGQQPSFGQPNPYANTTGQNATWANASVMGPMGGGKGGKSGAAPSGGGKGQSNYTPLPPIANYRSPVTAPANNFQNVPNPAEPNNSTAGF